MTVTEKLKRAAHKSARLRRHLAALMRYGTPRKFINIARAEMDRIRGREVVSGRPYMLIIDPLNVCNLKCPLCPTGKGELPLKNGRMRREQFETLIDELAPHAVKVMLYNWGEPFLHPDIIPMIRHAHRRRIATALSTNLNLLPAEGAEAVVRSGLDEMIVSCDGLTQETYEKYRVRGNLERVFANLRAITDARRQLGRRHPRIEFQFLVFAHNEHEVPRVEEVARGLGADEVRIMAPYGDDSHPDIKPARDPRYRRAGASDTSPDVFSPDADLDAIARLHPPPLRCFWPWRCLVVNWNGQVDPCCFKNYHAGFGNVFETNFADLWNGHIYRQSRRWITGKPLRDDGLRIVCKGCEGYH